MLLSASNANVCSAFLSLLSPLLCLIAALHALLPSSPLLYYCLQSSTRSI